MPPGSELKMIGDWVLARFGRPPAHSRARSMAIIASLVFAVGVVDWLTTIRISLSIFYLVPVGLSVLWLGRAPGVTVACVCVTVRLLGDFMAADARLAAIWIWWNAAVLLAVFLLVVGILDALRTLYSELEQRVNERTRDLQLSVQARHRVERELREAGSRERAAIGRELHDDLCQHLVATAFATKVLGEKLAGAGHATARECQAIVDLLEEGVAKTRNLARGLLLADIHPDELPNALANLATGSSTGSVTCGFRALGHSRLVDAGTAAQLFRIAQEAMRNSLRHARPHNVHVTLDSDDTECRLVIEDDGCGIPEPGRRGAGIGLRIMAHRATVIGGVLAIEPIEGGGTRVTCRVPHARTGEALAPAGASLKDPTS